MKARYQVVNYGDGIVELLAQEQALNGLIVNLGGRTCLTVFDAENQAREGMKSRGESWSPTYTHEDGVRIATGQWVNI